MFFCRKAAYLNSFFQTTLLSVFPDKVFGDDVDLPFLIMHYQYQQIAKQGGLL